jgi:5S rRNA maturation endonuclease (ribonuclease M5)
MFRSLLRQLCLEHNSAMSHVASVFAEHETAEGDFGIQWDWRTNELKNMLEEQLLIVALTRQVILFVDALDEAGEETARTLAEYFNDLTTQFKEQNASLKICISARHYPILIRTVSKDVWVEEENGHDIRTVVRQQLDKVKILSAENDKLLCDEISNRAKGIFQWGKSSK